MTRRRIAQSIGWIQIVLGVSLGITAVMVFTMYRSSLGSVSTSLAESMVTVSDGLKQVVTVIDSRQVLIDDAASSMQSARQALVAAQALVDVQAQQLPTYSGSFAALSQTMSSFGAVLISTGNLFRFSVPTGVQINHIPWVVTYSQPMAATATSFTQEGQNLQNISATLSSTANSLNVDGPRFAKSLIDTLNSTTQLIDDANKAAAALKSTDLPALIKQLKYTSDSLREAGARTASLGQLAWAILLLGVLLSASFVVSGIGLILTNGKGTDLWPGNP